MEQRNFKTPEEEIAHLRAELASREAAIRSASPEATQEQLHAVGKEVLRAYEQKTDESVLAPERRLSFVPQEKHITRIENARDAKTEVLTYIKAEGIKKGLSLLKKMNDANVMDAVHDHIVEELRAGLSIPDLKEGERYFEALHMSLFEVAVLRKSEENTRESSISDEIGIMMRFFAGMQSLGYGGREAYYSFEIAISEGSDEIVFYIAVPTVSAHLFEQHILSLFPRASISFKPEDYNIFVPDGVAHVAVADLSKHAIYPLAELKSFTHDPIDVLVQTLTKIEKEGGGASVQFLLSSKPYTVARSAQETILKRVKKGDNPKDAIQESTFSGMAFATVKDLFVKKDSEEKPKESDPKIIQLFERKLATDTMSAEIRVVSSAKTLERAREISRSIQSSFNQFGVADGNSFRFRELSGGDAQDMVRAFSFREPITKHTLALSQEEVALLAHFPQGGITRTVQLKKISSRRVPAPVTLPREGVLLGINRYQGTETKIFVTQEDRLRHFYIIGQTGTGKTTLMKNMIVQDIQNGDGVCMIDPHGTDLADIMGAIPPERYEDVIYFDPAYMERSIGLNILEYNPNNPQEKTFVVDELFAIFDRLYDMKATGGPMFEQYFRNAAQLILEDPDSGSTLFDISRVFADAQYRNYKLSKAKNPVVVQFWRDIATKAGGEASLENIIPYIVSKVDVFTANDYLRPILGQQQSTFNFREIMDTRKILLVNLSKGRLGERNANLIGMMIVGKFLMAALSRVDDPTKGFPPFYLHMDEFQNVTTTSIAQILSEARKYKLGLTIAHQYITQIDERIKEAVFGNVGNMAIFRISPDDAKYLESKVAPEFTVGDLSSMENRNACLSVLANGTPTRPFSLETLPPPPSNPELVSELITFATLRYGRNREEVEEEIRQKYR